VFKNNKHCRKFANFLECQNFAKFADIQNRRAGYTGPEYKLQFCTNFKKFGSVVFVDKRLMFGKFLSFFPYPS